MLKDNNVCRVCQSPVRRCQQLCDNHATRRTSLGVIENKCLRCGRQFKRRRKRAKKYCSSFCRNEQNIADKLSRGGYAEIPDTKTCKTCSVEKPSFKFCINAYSRDGLRSRCRDCDKAYNKGWRERNLDYKEQARAKNLARNFGITIDEYDGLLRFQGGVCCICKKPPQEGKKRLAVDHDHRTGEIRGLLHGNPCNKTAVGYHDINSAKSLLSYLEQPPARLFFNGQRIVERSKSTGRRRKYF